MREESKEVEEDEQKCGDTRWGQERDVMKGENEKRLQ